MNFGPKLLFESETVNIDFPASEHKANRALEAFGSTLKWTFEELQSFFTFAST